ncbi:MAG: phosphodiester glycosidase family protein [Verrucomicrobiota bacterium]
MSFKTSTLTVCSALLPALTTVQAIEYSTLEFGDTRATVCKIDTRKERLQLFLRDEDERPFHHFERLASWLETRKQTLIFAMNAGMYHRDYSPVGLFVSEGKQAFPPNYDDGKGNFFLKPNGIFAITERNAYVIDSSDYGKIRGRVLLATQSGPLLLKNGTIHPAFKPDSDSRLIRNGVGILSPGVALFVINETPLNLYEFACLFKDRLHCQNALYFDGNVSSLYSSELKRNDIKTHLGPIIGVTENLPATARPQTIR